MGSEKELALENSERCSIHQGPVRKTEAVTSVSDRGDLILGIGYSGTERLKKTMRSFTPCWCNPEVNMGCFRKQLPSLGLTEKKRENLEEWVPCSWWSDLSEEGVHSPAGTGPLRGPGCVLRLPKGA